MAQLETELEKKEETVTRACNELKESEKQRSNLDEMISKLKGRFSRLFQETT